MEDYGVGGKDNGFEVNDPITTGRAEKNKIPFDLPYEGVNLEELEKHFLSQALQRTKGNQSAAARLLGISRYALRYRTEKYNL